MSAQIRKRINKTLKATARQNISGRKNIVNWVQDYEILAEPLVAVGLSTKLSNGVYSYEKSRLVRVCVAECAPTVLQGVFASPASEL